jgi:nitrite reductase/ring-hydroxylating ferredoxin subunit/uncharacterized membrane protein
MKSAASFRSHPIHPALVTFPFAFLVGALLFDVVGLMTDRATFWHTAGHLVLAGLATAVLAAVPGIIDYVYTVPPNSSAKKRATRHAASNAIALVLFAAAVSLRDVSQRPEGAVILLEILGVGALLYAGWQGGVLVTRNMISVDHRHAQAGKWSEITVEPQRGPVVVARRTELKPGQMRLIRFGDKRIVLAHTGQGYRAFADGCTHRGASLADGVLIGNLVQCLWHGSRFDCTTGQAVCGPAKRAVHAYPVTEDGNGIAVTIAD